MMGVKFLASKPYCLPPLRTGGGNDIFKSGLSVGVGNFLVLGGGNAYQGGVNFPVGSW